MQNDELMQFLLAYTKRFRFEVFPCSKNKSPLTKTGFYEATVDELKIKEWWRKFPDSNIGLRTGELLVIDVDPKNKGFESLSFLKSEHDIDLLDTPTVITGGGGLHYYFINNYRLGCSTILPGIDIKANGGYVIAPPSLHNSGKKYEWKVSPNQTSFMKTPEWLLNYTSAKEKNGFDRRVWAHILENPILEGERANTMVKFAGKFLHQFPVEEWECLVSWSLLALNDKFFKPPLSEEEVLKIIKSIASKELKQRCSNEAVK